MRTSRLDLMFAKLIALIFIIPIWNAYWVLILVEAMPNMTGYRQDKLCLLSRCSREVGQPVGEELTEIEPICCLKMILFTVTAENKAMVRGK